MKFNTIDDFDVKGKKILLRADINSDVINGKVILTDRIRSCALTIKELQEKNARIIVIAHQGRPKNYDFISLKQHANLLNKFIKIEFVDSTINNKAINVIRNLKNGEAVLLENLRFLKEEFNLSK